MWGYGAVVGAISVWRCVECVVVVFCGCVGMWEVVVSLGGCGVNTSNVYQVESAMV